MTFNACGLYNITIQSNINLLIIPIFKNWIFIHLCIVQTRFIVLVLDSWYVSNGFVNVYDLLN